MTPNKFSSLSEKKLVALSKKGDCLAFEELLNRSKDLVFASIIRRISSIRLSRINRGAADEDDIYNLSSAKAWKNIKKFKGDSKFSTWLIRIAINEITDEARRNLSKQCHSLELLEEESGEQSTFQSQKKTFNEAISKISYDEIKKIYHEALNKLKPNHRIAVHLFVEEGLSYEEISRACAVPIGTIMSRLFYSRIKLKKEINLLLNK